jgi:hypothetical protein
MSRRTRRAVIGRSGSGPQRGQARSVEAVPVGGSGVVGGAWTRNALRTTPDDFRPESLVRKRVPPASSEPCIAAGTVSHSDTMSGIGTIRFVTPKSTSRWATPRPSRIRSVGNVRSRMCGQAAVAAEAIIFGRLPG